MTVRQIGLHELAVERREVDRCWVRVAETPAELEAAEWTAEQRRVCAGMPAPVYSNEKRASEVREQVANIRRGLAQMRVEP